MAKCIFCGGGSSDEHIIAQWLIRDLGLDRQPIELGFGAQQNGVFETITEPLSLRRFLLTSVCTPCNTGWMSRLENVAKRTLTPLLGEEWPILDIEVLKRIRPVSKEICLWLLKTAITFGEKMSVIVPRNVRSAIFGGTVPPGVYVDLACSQLSGPYVGIMREWNVAIGDDIRVRRCEDSFRMTWQMRHLVLRVSYFRKTEVCHRRPRHPVVVYPIFGLPSEYEQQTESGVITLNRGYVYDHVKQLEDETVFRAIS